MDENLKRLWASRALIGLVLIWNVQCALAFLIAPDRYSGGFGLEGVIGAGMVRALGILFLMWNVPYAVAANHPLRRLVSLYEAIAMQSIGLVGETLLLASFPVELGVVRETVLRFILFDGLGLVFLMAALLVIKPPFISRANAHGT